MADSQPSKTTKRRLRASTQTVRQQAEQAQTEVIKPTKKRRLRSSMSKAGKPLSPVGRFFKRVFNRQPFIFIGHILWPRFMRNAFRELKFVTWPTRKQSRDLTFAVLMFAIVFGVAITIIDYGLDKLFKALIIK